MTTRASQPSLGFEIVWRRDDSDLTIVVQVRGDSVHVGPDGSGGWIVGTSPDDALIRLTRTDAGHVRVTECASDVHVTREDRPGGDAEARVRVGDVVLQVSTLRVPRDCPTQRRVVWPLVRSHA